MGIFIDRPGHCEAMSRGYLKYGELWCLWCLWCLWDLQDLWLSYGIYGFTVGIMKLTLSISVNPVLLMELICETAYIVYLGN
jgi:hypothetical protein